MLLTDPSGRCAEPGKGDDYCYDPTIQSPGGDNTTGSTDTPTKCELKGGTWDVESQTCFLLGRQTQLKVNQPVPSEAMPQNNPLVFPDAGSLGGISITPQPQPLGGILVTPGASACPGLDGLSFNNKAKEIDKKPSAKACDKAIKLLTQYERLAGKFGVKLSPGRIKELNRKRDLGIITSYDLPAILQREFPREFEGMTLNEIRAMCGRKSREPQQPGAYLVA